MLYQRYCYTTSDTVRPRSHN